ncbi:hypothetical protein [Thiomicrorhabdus indica]|uniref:hypothetical protein n=1 Tax=Thiomicrorhabdus indica TaxID=2267253 RepID=UPI00102DD14E|nr:hypothetical protein [Thiomicrorhabdus indica]
MNLIQENFDFSKQDKTPKATKNSKAKKINWKRKLNGLHIKDKDLKHASFMAIYMIVELKTTLAKAKRSASNRHGVPMSKIESIAKEVLGQKFFDSRRRFSKN